MPKQLVLEFPVEFPEEELEDVDLLNQGKEAIVLSLFQKGRVSSGYAADLLGLSLADFMELLKRKEIPFAHYTNIGEGMKAGKINISYCILDSSGSKVITGRSHIFTGFLHPVVHYYFSIHWTMAPSLIISS